MRHSWLDADCSNELQKVERILYLFSESLLRLPTAVEFRNRMLFNLDVVGKFFRYWSL